MSNQLENQYEKYNKIKKAIYLKNSGKKSPLDLDDFEVDLADFKDHSLGVSDIMQVGSRIVIGGGLGLLAGVATIAVVASAAEVVVAGVVTKVAGVVGGAIGLSLGLASMKKKKREKLVH